MSLHKVRKESRETRLHKLLGRLYGLIGRLKGNSISSHTSPFLTHHLHFSRHRVNFKVIFRSVRLFFSACATVFHDFNAAQPVRIKLIDIGHTKSANSTQTFKFLGLCNSGNRPLKKQVTIVKMFGALLILTMETVNVGPDRKGFRGLTDSHQGIVIGKAKIQRGSSYLLSNQPSV